MRRNGRSRKRRKNGREMTVRRPARGRREKRKRITKRHTKGHSKRKTKRSTERHTERSRMMSLFL